MNLIASVGGAISARNIAATYTSEILPLSRLVDLSGTCPLSLTIEFETQRLLLRQWKAADRGPWAALNADPIVMAHFPAPLSRAESDATADRCESLLATRGWGVWAAEMKATGEFIGFVGLHIPPDYLPVSPCVEILWRLAHSHWRQGFATEAARGALRLGFEVLGLPEIVSFTVPANTRSRAVMERLGMQMDAATFEHPGLPEGHVLRTHCNYRLARERWLSGSWARILQGTEFVLGHHLG